MLSGDEAQVDPTHFDKMWIGRAIRDLFAVAVVLACGWMGFVYFAMRAAMATLR